MPQSANLYARIEPNVKERAEEILSSLGITASNAITMFYRQIILHGGIPFELKLPMPPLSLEFLSDDDLHIALDKGYISAQKGMTRPAEEAFAELHRDFRI